MKENAHLYILWTNSEMIAAEEMVLMYGVNSLLQGWWEKVTIIVWGASARLVTENVSIQDRIKDAIEAGINVTVSGASLLPEWKSWQATNTFACGTSP